MPVRVDSKGMTEFFGAMEAGVQKATLAGAGVYRNAIQNKIVTNHGGTVSKPGEPPHSQTGDLIRSVTVSSDKTGTARIGPGVPYAPWLEFGTSKMAPRPYMRPVAADKGVAAKVVAKVRDVLKESIGGKVAAVTASAGVVREGGAP